MKQGLNIPNNIYLMLLLCNIHILIEQNNIKLSFKDQICMFLHSSAALTPRHHLSISRGNYGELPVLPAPGGRGLRSHVTVLSEEPSYSAQEEANSLQLHTHLS